MRDLTWDKLRPGFWPKLMRTRIILTVFIGALIGAGFVGGCGYSGYGVANDVLLNRLGTENWQLRTFRWCFNGLSLVDQLDRLLDDKTYIVLLQNNHELRPTGGFMGSYARVKVQGSGLKEFVVQDIYVPDGQIVGHVDPPAPVQQAFGQGWWRLRDSNWDPDFTMAAPQIAWFFDQGGEKVDGIVAVNLSFVNLLLEKLGEIKTTDYPETISTAAFYDLAQKYAEVGFFPGSTQKRDFLGAVGNALFERIKHTSLIERIKLIKLIYSELKKGEILVWFKDADLQQAVKQRGWDGGLGDYAGDYLYIVETNLGANKANCCVTREVRQEKEKVLIIYQNNHPFENPRPPVFWGGNYVNYLRVIVPMGAQVQRVKVAERELVEKPLDNQYGLQEDRYQIEDRGRFKTIGFWAVVPAQQSLSVSIEYRLSNIEYQSVLVRHQPGMGGFPYRLVIDGQTVASDTIDRDKEYLWTK